MRCNPFQRLFDTPADIPRNDGPRTCLVINVLHSFGTLKSPPLPRHHGRLPGPNWRFRRCWWTALFLPSACSMRREGGGGISYGAIRHDTHLGAGLPTPLHLGSVGLTWRRALSATLPVVLVVRDSSTPSPREPRLSSAVRASYVAARRCLSRTDGEAVPGPDREEAGVQRTMHKLTEESDTRSTSKHNDERKSALLSNHSREKLKQPEEEVANENNRGTRSVWDVDTQR